MDASGDPSDRPAGDRPRSGLPPIKYQIRQNGAVVRWSPASRLRQCECRSNYYAYPNALVLAVAKEREELADDNAKLEAGVAKLEAEVAQVRATNEKQASRIKELEYDVLEVEDRVDDLCDQLRQARERELKRARKVRGRAEAILNLCDVGLEEDSDEASRFIQGLNVEIQKDLAAAQITAFSEAVEKAQRVESARLQAEVLHSGVAKLGEDRGEMLRVARLQHLAVPTGIAGSQTTTKITAGGNRHIYTYPNEVVLAIVKEWEVLAKDNARLETEVNQLKETIKTQTDRIKELEYDVVEGRERVDDLCAQLGEAQECMIKRAMNVRNRVESILNICDDLLLDVSDETFYIGGEVGVELAQAERSASPAAD
nr:serologically defined colon cancer antigen 8 homolog [Coffea arabica]